MTTNDNPPKRRGRPPKPRPLFPEPPRPVGRPPKSEEDRKTTLLALRLTNAEHQEWRDIADELNMPLTIFIREAVRKEIRRKERKK